MAPLRIAVVVVAYNAEATLREVLDRIPAAFVPRIASVLVCDDASTDGTHDAVVQYQSTSSLPITVIRHPVNLGYGGNQKHGYQWAIDNGMDAVVLLHGDGQYAPERLGEVVAPLDRGDADAVLASRMIHRLDALRGGMPLYKFAGNIALTTLQNALTGARLSEWHTGYRAYLVSALRAVDFHANSDEFDFDTQIILQLLAAGKRFAEVPIPTYYGEEISHVNSIRYGLQIVGHTLRHRRVSRPARR